MGHWSSILDLLARFPARCLNKATARILALLTVSAIILPANLQAGASERPGSLLPIPSSGALFGAAVFPGDKLGPNKWEANLAFEAQIGRRMTLERRYFAWDDVFPTANEYLSRDAGRMLILSWGAGMRDGTNADWADIAAGTFDSTIDARAADLKAFAAPMFFVFHHEPNGNHKAGTPEEFIAAYQHVRNRFVADGVKNLMYTMVMFDTAFDTGQINDYYPGDAYVDVLGVDAYNWYQCMDRNEPWTSFHDIALAFHDFGAAHGKPMIVAEWGSDEDPLNAARKGQWFTDAAATLKSWPDIRGVAYFNTGPPEGLTCNWWVDSSPASLAAYIAMGADPYFNPRMKKPAPTNLTYVNAEDNDFSPVNGYPAPGHGVKWLFQGPDNNHAVTDSSGMGYFDSGTKTPGTVWTFTFIAASNYQYKCTLHSTMLGTVKVPDIITPPSGGVSTRFTITWASASPPAGYVYDVQIKRPGSSSWRSLLSDVTTTSTTFTPDSGVGTYSFRSRLKKSSTGKFADWSNGVPVVVS